MSQQSTKHGQWYKNKSGGWVMWSRVSTAIWQMNRLDKLLKQIRFVEDEGKEAQ